VNKKDLKKFEKILLEERAKLVKELDHLDKTVLSTNPRDASGDLSAYSFHMADLGTDAMEREKAFLFASAEGRLLYQVDEALRRIYRGEYGKCQSCGDDISHGRLEAMPMTLLCIDCKEKEEKANR
jgi:RNA polymerase-binding protein DksA